MATNWQATNHPCVRYREHSSRRIGRSPMKDRYYAIHYKFRGKKKWEGIGWQSEGFTLEIALQALANAKTAIKQGLEVVTLRQRRELAVKEQEAKDRNRITIREYWDKVYSPIVASRLVAKPYHAIRGFFSNHFLPVFGGTSVVEFGSKQWLQLQELLNNSYSLKTKGVLSQATRRSIAAELRRMLQHAKESGLSVQKIPSLKELGLTPSKNRRERIVTPSEAKAILNELQNTDINAYFITKFAFLTGCRFGEAAWLKWVEIYPDSLVFLDTKNKSNRRLPLTTELKALFAEIKEMLEVKEYVFYNTLGERYTAAPNSFRCAIDRLKFNEGHEKLDRITFHAIRHTVASKMAQILDIRSLMDFMGWREISMAARYIHSDRETTLAAAETLGTLFKTYE